MTSQSHRSPALLEAADPGALEVPGELTPTRFAMERGLLVIGDRTELVLVRHAQQVRTLDEAYRPGGPRLSDAGRAQAKLTGDHLAGEIPQAGRFDAVYCSDLNRTAETARIIADTLGLPNPTPDAGLREIDLYSRDRGGADVSPAVQERAGKDFACTLQWDSFPNTESGADFRHRIRSTLTGIARRHENGRVVVVSHAGAISAMIAALVNADPDMFYFAGHASVNRIFHGDDHFVTHSLNEVGHLRSAGALTF